MKIQDERVQAHEDQYLGAHFEVYCLMKARQNRVPYSGLIYYRKQSNNIGRNLLEGRRNLLEMCRYPILFPSDIWVNGDVVE